MSRSIVIGENRRSKIVIKNNSMTVQRNPDTTLGDRTGIIHIMTNASIELGRSYVEMTDAIKKTRLPLSFIRIVKQGDLEMYKVTRINTGKVPSTDLGIIEVYKGKIFGYTFNRKVFKDRRLVGVIRPSALNSIYVERTVESSKRTHQSNRADGIKMLDNILTVVGMRGNAKKYSKVKVTNNKIIIEIPSNIYIPGIVYNCIEEGNKLVIGSIAIDRKR